MSDKRFCVLCGKRLRAFSKEFDWKNRKMHKTCWKDTPYWLMQPKYKFEDGSRITSSELSS